MLNINKSVNIYAQSVLKEEGKADILLSTMDANITSDGSVNINKNVASNELYATHKETIEKDWADFEAKVYKDYAGDITPESPVNA